MISKLKMAIVNFLLHMAPVKKTIQKIEESHLSEIQKMESEYFQDSLIRMDNSAFDTKLSFLLKKVPNEFDNLCERYGTDKGYTNIAKRPFGWIPHNYSIYYSRIFADLRYAKINVFECGIGTNNPNLPSNMTENGNPGASLRVWKEYFPNACIYGADIDKSILFCEDRIVTAYMDHRNPKSIELYFEQLGDIQFEIMIDDGLHTFDSSITLFENSIKHLNDTGIYIIEDVFPENFEHFSEYFSKFEYHVEYVVLENTDRKNVHDNCLITISRGRSFPHRDNFGLDGGRAKWE